MKRFLFILSLIISCAAAAAQENNSPITVIAEEVTDAEAKERSTGTVDIINVSDAETKHTSLSEVLSERAGIQVKRYGGVGSRSTVSIRGSNPNQVVVYLDGIPLTDARFGEVNLEDIPLDNVERIEVYRGFTPAGFSSAGMGGVVNIITKKAKKGSNTSVSAGYGSYNTYKAAVSRSQSFEKWRYLLFLNTAGSRGDYRYKNDNGTPVVNTADDFWTIRKNNDHYSFAGTGSLGYTSGKWDFLFMNDGFYKRQGLPGMGGSVTETADLSTFRNISSMKIDARGLFTEQYRAGMNLYYALRRDTLRDPDNELGLGDGNTKGCYDSFGLDFLSQYAFPEPAQIVKLNLSVSREGFGHVDSVSGSPDMEYPRQRRTRFSAVAEDEALFFNERLMITPQARYDFWGDSFVDEADYEAGTGKREARVRHAPGWQFGARFYMVKEKLYLRGTIGQSIRIPGFTELFGDRGYILGNQDLEHEHSLGGDAGLGYVHENKQAVVTRISFECVYFYKRVYDYIALIHNSQFTLKPQNIGEAEITGCEVIAAADVTSHVAISGNYTFQRALNKGALPAYRDKYLPHRPVHEASGNIKVFNRWVSISYETSYTGFNFLDPYNTKPYYIDYRILHNAELKIFPLEGMTITFEAENFTDNHVSDVYNMPLPGRSYYLTLGYSWQ